MLKQILQEFLSIHGVTAAALVSGDGFVIASAGIVPPDTDALGALSASSIRSFARGGASMDTGALRKIILEYQNGALLLTPVTEEEFLVILTSGNNSLTNLSYSVAKTSSRIAAAL
jgi:uncharacterized protein